jgi:hypothetical protein
MLASTKRGTRENHVPVPLCPPKTSSVLGWDRNWNWAVRGRRQSVFSKLYCLRLWTQRVQQTALFETVDTACSANCTVWDCGHSVFSKLHCLTLWTQRVQQTALFDTVDTACLANCTVWLSCGHKFSAKCIVAQLWTQRVYQTAVCNAAVDIIVTADHFRSPLSRPFEITQPLGRCCWPHAIWWYFVYISTRYTRSSYVYGAERLLATSNHCRPCSAMLSSPNCVIHCIL